MQGFLSTAPVLVKVNWAESEVALINGEPTPYGLLAQTALGDGGVTRWMVPWSAIQYIKQDIPAPPPAQATVQPPPPPSRGDTPPGRAG